MRDIPLLQRLQFEVSLSWKLLPSNLDFGEWLFSPSFVLTYPGKKITSRAQTPDGIRPFFADKDMKARFFWLAVALRVVGVDVGFGLFYRQKAEIPT